MRAGRLRVGWLAGGAALDLDTGEARAGPERWTPPLLGGPGNRRAPCSPSAVELMILRLPLLKQSSPDASPPRA